MRFLIPLLISFCFTVASLQSNAGVVYGEKTDYFMGNELPIAENTNINYQQPIADLLYLNQQRSSQVYFNYWSIAGSGNDWITGKINHSPFRFLIPKFLYCKSIGLILIFPKHYFF